MYGFVIIETNEDWKRHSGTFREALNHFGVSEGRMRGAYIPLNTVESTVDHVILIGDAGGFPNKLTGEGLYDAFKTAYNAFRAITENKPFHETNAAVFKKMEDQKKVYNFFFSRFGYPLIRWAAGYPKIIKWMFDAKMKRETFRERR
jgi:flavin-dependent dehydrogenase